MSSGSKKLKAKKKKVMKKSAKISPTTIFIVALLTIMFGGGAYLTFGNSDATTNTSSSGAQSNTISTALEQIRRISVADAIDYSVGRVDMAEVDYQTEGDWVTLALDDIIAKKLVTFGFESPEISAETQNFAGEAKLPMMALIDPSGDLMVGVSYCEPCRSTTFHTEEDGTLTCNLCGTKWDMESLAPRAGACGAFPPDEIEVDVEDGKVRIPKDKLESWKPREEV